MTTTNGASVHQLKRPGAVKRPDTAAKTFYLADGKTEPSVDAVNRALGVYEVKVPAAATTQERVVVLRTKIAMVSGSRDCYECACGEVSTDLTGFCPFCGTIETDSAQVAATRPSEAADIVVLKKGESIPVSDMNASADVKLSEFESRVARIRDLAKNTRVNLYDIGVEFDIINKNFEWKSKGYKNFRECVIKETNFTAQYVYQLIGVTKEFGRDTYLETGNISKLFMVQQVENTETRAALLEEIKSEPGLPRRVLATRIKEIRAEEGTTPKERAARTAPATEPKRVAPKPDGAITLLAKVNGKAETYQFRNAETGRALKAYKPGAYVEIEISDDVVLRLLPVFEKGTETLVGLKRAFVRVEEK